MTVLETPGFCYNRVCARPVILERCRNGRETCLYHADAAATAAHHAAADEQRRLAALAPELLAFVRKALQLAESVHAVSELAGLPTTMVDGMAAEARALVAKADGEEPG